MADRANALAFLCYSREDNAHDYGFADRLCEKLMGEVGVQTGSTVRLQIFIDRNDVHWGQPWRDRVSQGLRDAAFLIPIVTPNFLNSVECRDEVLKFAGHERARGRKDLILPIYYLDDPRITAAQRARGKPSADEVADIIVAHNYKDWRDLRHEDLDAPAARKLIARAIEDLLGTLNDLHSGPPVAGPKGREWVVDGMHHQTLSAVLPMCGAGHTVIMMPGVYEESSLRIDHAINIRSDDPTRPAVIRVNGDEGIHLAGTSFALEHLVVEHAGPARHKGCAVRVQSSAGTFKNIEVRSNGFACVVVESGAGPRLIDCTLRGGLYGLSVPGNASPVMERGEVTGAYAGLCLNMGSQAALKGTRIYGNEYGAFLHRGAGGKIENCDLRGNRHKTWSIGSDVTTARSGNLE